MTDQRLRSELGEARNAYFAEMATVWIGLAAATHPEELRKAFASVFDLAGVEESHKRLALVLAQSQAVAVQARELLHEVSVSLDRIEKRLDYLDYTLTLLEARCSA
jgi:hypothetical protein